MPRGRAMDWFEHLTGFRETGYGETQARLRVVDGRLVHEGSDESFAVGALTLPSLAELRTAALGVQRPGRLRLSIAEGDVRAMHGLPENRGALFQVASQFNMLEMVGPDVTPEHGVAGYAHDRTQGPACAMAAGAATIYRNYLVPVTEEIGQTAERQLDGLSDFGDALAQRLSTDRGSLWVMRNGYALPTRDGLMAIAEHLGAANENALNDLRGRLRLGLHQDVEVTDGPAPGPLVSQIFCSALPVAYTRLPASAWASFALLVLEAAYEGTLLAGVLNAARGASNRVLLTRLGGGAFGNADAWIDVAMLRALRLARGQDLDVAIVSYGPPSLGLRHLVRSYDETGRTSDSDG
ncbi:hypothetical protein LNAOJCKE_1577 [Methylorubrum aminovorans]|uniref:Uncharacterized protein n=1 Tax=Methylorubrum aminovorans TaxID=269069 RepID=A0ABQ4UD06_9HYPH|nr:hypothetical protein [Methylorubrum aminovorans]GJE64373.1 hypothetical protein LNAOJCKE_1577 [Methylorubrum aminovorans]GMA76566.1 hypothetical protein GCM10025880_29830 [Methylorubrum aminovorans]